MDIEWEPDAAADATGAPLGGSGLQPGLATFRAVELGGRTYDVEMALDLTDEGLMPTSVRVSSRDGSAVTGTELRAVRVRELVQAAYVYSMKRPSAASSPSADDLVSLVSVAAPNGQLLTIAKDNGRLVPGDPVSRFRDGRWLPIGEDGRMLPDDLARACRFQGPTPATLAWVALIYGSAKARGLRPARQVEKDLGLPRTTASKWVRRAREQGFLDEKGDSNG